MEAVEFQIFRVGGQWSFKIIVASEEDERRVLMSEGSFKTWGAAWDAAISEAVERGWV